MPSAQHSTLRRILCALRWQRNKYYGQESWDPAKIMVRMGIHTGAAQLGDLDDRSGGYSGYMTPWRVCNESCPALTAVKFCSPAPAPSWCVGNYPLMCYLA